MMKQQQKNSRVRQRSDYNDNGDNADKMVNQASIEDDIRRMTENFEDEGGYSYFTD